MRTDQNTTHLYLDKGMDDVALLKEIRSLIAATGIKSSKTFAGKYPVLWELKQQMEAEIAEENAD